MRMTVEQLGSLRKADSTLYHFVLPAAHGVDGKTVEIDLTKIDGLHQKLLENWAKENGIEQLQQPHDEQRCGCTDCFTQRTSRLAAREHARLQKEAGGVRLSEYLAGRVPGFLVLLDTPANRAKFNTLIKTHPKLKDVELGPQLVDAAVQLLQGELEWRKPETPAPPQPAPEPVVLSDGLPQKSLDDKPNNSWSVEQLKDWSKRSDAQKLFRQQQYGGGIRSSWFKADSQVV